MAGNRCPRTANAITDRALSRRQRLEWVWLHGYLKDTLKKCDIRVTGWDPGMLSDHADSQNKKQPAPSEQNQDRLPRGNCMGK